MVWMCRGIELKMVNVCRMWKTVKHIVKLMFELTQCALMLYFFYACEKHVYRLVSTVFFFRSPYRAFRWFGIRMNSICQRFSASRVATQESNDRQTPSFVFDPIQLPMGVCYLILLSHSLFSLIISHFNRLRHKSSVLHFSQRLNAKNTLFYW